MNIHELAAPFALNALDPVERNEFEAHLETCAECRLEVSDLQQVTAWIGAAESASPSPAVRDRVLTGIGHIEQEQAPAMVTPLRRLRPQPWMAAAVVALVAAVAALSFVIVRLGDQVDRMEAMREIMAAPDAAIASLEGEIPGQFYYSMAMDRAVLVSDDMPSVSGDETYELWLIRDGAPTPAGLFRPSDGVVTLLVDGGLVRAELIGVTVEPKGGSELPTGEILASAALG